MDAFLRQLGIELPIVQVPTTGVSTPEMAAAVSNAGEIGSLDADATRQLIAAVRARSERPFQVNVFCHKPPATDAALESAWLEQFTVSRKPEAPHPGHLDLGEGS